MDCKEITMAQLGVVPVRLAPETRKELEREAKRDDRTVSYIARQVLDRWAENQRRKRRRK